MWRVAPECGASMLCHVARELRQSFLKDSASVTSSALGTRHNDTSALALATKTRTTARPTNKQHTNDWFSALFRQFRRFAPILEPSLHGARGLTSFIHHASGALRALCPQVGTTFLIQLRPRDHWVRAAHTNFELIESRARHCSSRSVLRDAFQADELGLRISSSPPPWSCHNRKQLRSGLMGPWAISKIEVWLEVVAGNSAGTACRSTQSRLLLWAEPEITLPATGHMVGHFALQSVMALHSARF